jgi:hypothetical protein
MARKHSEQLALRPPAGTKDRLLALQRDGETLLSVVLRAVDALEREELKLPLSEAISGRPRPPEATQTLDRPSNLERGLDIWLGALTDTLGAALNRLDTLESSQAQPRDKAADAHLSGSMAEFAKSHPDMVEDVETGDASPPLMERTPDTERCECRTSNGTRCRNKTVTIVKARVRGSVAEFGCCRRHALNFEPYSVYW